MDYLVVFIILIILVIIIKISESSTHYQKKEKEIKTEEKLPFKKRDYLLSVAEKNFFVLLDSLLDNNNYHIFCKVRMSDLLWFPKNSKKTIIYRNQTERKHIDFVICSKKNISPLLAIELDDSSHKKDSSKKNDKFKNEVFKAAKLPLLRVWVRQKYNKEWLQNQLNKYL